MDTFECIKTRRSVRKFTDKPIVKETLEKLIEAAQLAPSWKNAQTTRFTAVSDTETLSKICATLGDWNRPIVGGASLLIAVSCVTRRSGYEKDGTPSSIYGEAYTYFDCGAAVENFCLAANDLGIGTVILGIFDPKKIKAILNLPDSEDLPVLIACGYKAEEPSTPARKAVGEVLRTK